MKPALASGTVVEYHFQCFCGTPIVATEKTVTCANCGKTLGIRRSRKHTRRRWYTFPLREPHRKLQLEDLEELAILIFVYLLLGFCVYDLGSYVYDLANN
jgi:hypothetical protein